MPMAPMRRPLCRDRVGGQSQVGGAGGRAFRNRTQRGATGSTFRKDALAGHGWEPLCPLGATSRPPCPAEEAARPGLGRPLAAGVGASRSPGARLPGAPGHQARRGGSGRGGHHQTVRRGHGGRQRPRPQRQGPRRRQEYRRVKTRRGGPWVCRWLSAAFQLPLFCFHLSLGA